MFNLIVQNKKKQPPNIPSASIYYFQSLFLFLRLLFMSPKQFFILTYINLSTKQLMCNVKHFILEIYNLLDLLLEELNLAFGTIILYGKQFKLLTILEFFLLHPLFSEQRRLKTVGQKSLFRI